MPPLRFCASPLLTDRFPRHARTVQHAGLSSSAGAARRRAPRGGYPTAPSEAPSPQELARPFFLKCVTGLRRVEAPTPADERCGAKARATSRASSTSEARSDSGDRAPTAGVVTSRSRLSRRRAIVFMRALHSERGRPRQPKNLGRSSRPEAGALAGALNGSCAPFNQDGAPGVKQCACADAELPRPGLTRGHNTAIPVTPGPQRPERCTHAPSVEDRERACHLALVPWP